MKKIASQIGWIIIEFNKLEWQLTEVLKEYFCNDPEEISALHYELISSTNFAKKADLLKDFYKVYGNSNKVNFDTSENLIDWNKQVIALIERLKKVSQIRNKYAHSFWHRLDQNKFVEFKSVINPNEGLNKIFLRFDVQDLKDDFKLITDLQITLFDINSMFNEAYTST